MSLPARNEPDMPKCQAMSFAPSMCQIMVLPWREVLTMVLPFRLCGISAGMGFTSGWFATMRIGAPVRRSMKLSTSAAKVSRLASCGFSMKVSHRPRMSA